MHYAVVRRRAKLTAQHRVIFAIPCNTIRDQIWSQLPPIGLPGLDSWSPLTLTWYWVPSLTFSNMYRLNTRAGVLPRSASSHFSKSFSQPTTQLHYYQSSLVFAQHSGRLDIIFVKMLCLTIIAGYWQHLLDPLDQDTFQLFSPKWLLQNFLNADNDISKNI